MRMCKLIYLEINLFRSRRKDTCCVIFLRQYDFVEKIETLKIPLIFYDSKLDFYWKLYVIYHILRKRFFLFIHIYFFT